MDGREWPAAGPVMRPGQVARYLRVEIKTLARWDETGMMPALKMESGHRRWLEADIHGLMPAGCEGPFLTPGEAAARLGMDPTTLRKKADEGRIAFARLPGGHRRFPESAVRALENGAAQ